eukprot:gene5942-6181_t
MLGQRVNGNCATRRVAGKRVHVASPNGRKCSSRTMPVVQCKKVAVMGAAGGIGQPLSLLLKMNKCVTELALYDVAPLVSSFVGDGELEGCLKGCELVVIPAGVPRKPGMTRDDLFNINAGIVMNIVGAAAKYCPEAVIQIISNPVNSTVPIASEVLKAAGVYNPNKLMGVTTLDVVRANTFVAEAKGLDLKETVPSVSFTDAERTALTSRIQDAGTEVVEAKAGAGSATLSMAYAAARMAESTLLGLQGEPNMFECAFVDSQVVPGCPFFASRVQLGPEGIAKVNGLGPLNDFEKAELEAMLPELKAQIEKGIAFAKNPPAKK